MSATGEDQDYVDALLATCGLPGCEQPPGKPCVNSVNGESARELPHWNRAVRGRRLNRGEVPIIETPFGGESTSAELRRVKAELGSALSQLNRRPRLPVNDDEVRRWYADRGLNMSCGPAVLFAALRRDFNQDQGAIDG